MGKNRCLNIEILCFVIFLFLITSNHNLNNVNYIDYNKTKRNHEGDAFEDEEDEKEIGGGEDEEGYVADEEAWGYTKRSSFVLLLAGGVSYKGDNDRWNIKSTPDKNAYSFSSIQLSLRVVTLRSSNSLKYIWCSISES